ncbi:MAG: PIN domain-containing protein [Planctomycetes bacterium]|nr:PIN domain-containing protein [Planctomycetota bacterium]MBI3846739.1 PIN domain-containing protein [Planctomycetota bacterium]
MSQIYLDACCIICLVEAAEPFRGALVAKLSALRSDPEARIATSLLSRLECRIRPLRRNDQASLAAYESFFGAERLALVPLSPAVIDRATEIRARYGFKTPDALHLATAVEGAADVFLTGDSNLTRCKELVVEVIGS